MLSKITTGAVLGLLSSGALAAPMINYTSSVASATSNPSYVSSYSSAPTEVNPDGDKFRYPLSNNFPNTSSVETAQIEQAAGGTLSNASAPATNSISPNSLNNLRLIAFNELFEVAFFTSLVVNITNEVPGYEIPPSFDLLFLLSTLSAVQAQEELHALNANAALVSQNANSILPCEYTFPTTNLADAIALASTFTDVVLGTLGDVQTVFAAENDDSLIRGIASVIGQEGEQNGFYRMLQGKLPSAQPFLTVGAREFAFSALQQNFVVPGSCPNLGDIDIPVIGGVLQLLSQMPEAGVDATLSFSFATQNWTQPEDYRLVLVNGVDVPVVQDLLNATYVDGVVTFEAQFLAATELLEGLTIASVIPAEAAAGITDVVSVAAAAVFGPALIETE